MDLNGVLLDSAAILSQLVTEVQGHIRVCYICGS